MKRWQRIVLAAVYGLPVMVIVVGGISVALWHDRNARWTDIGWFIVVCGMMAVYGGESVLRAWDDTRLAEERLKQGYLSALHAHHADERR